MIHGWGCSLTANNAHSTATSSHGLQDTPLRQQCIVQHRLWCNAVFAFVLLPFSWHVRWLHFIKSIEKNNGWTVAMVLVAQPIMFRMPSNLTPIIQRLLSVRFGLNNFFYICQISILRFNDSLKIQLESATAFPILPSAMANTTVFNYISRCLILLVCLLFLLFKFVVSFNIFS